ncbi:mammalian cell entry protein [Nocardioides sp. Root79]|nr:mammalian cell entry protein [Nocardioides sp. Root79]KRC71564.1 mammalian cell entry protein [Nocardioides sp. Root240]
MPLAVVAAASLAAIGRDGYQVQVTLESATNVVEGSPVQVNGFDAGRVEKIEVVDGAARLTLSLDDDIAPLHSGAVVLVGWKATLSERLVEVTDGSGKNAEIPDGGLLPGTMPAPTEIDDVLNSLDAKTRAHLQSLFGNLGEVLAGKEGDYAATIRTGGPALRELGQLLKALGTDGPAIKHLAQRLDDLLGIVAERDSEVQSVVSSLSGLTDRVAGQRTQLRATLKALPGTLRQADRTLSDVPGAVDDVVPLLQDLEPATAKLGPVAKDLAPLLQDLRPLSADLRPALGSLDSLLQVAPGLFDTVGAVTPQTRSVLGDVREPIAFLRPYTPEVAGFFSTWASAFSNYDSNSNFARIHGQAGLTSLNENPGVVPPGVTFDPYPSPGEIVGQGWTDANGSELE